ncbi:hypothetical protein FACS1894122_12780 [Alphaproteobacteria bacterium]|nr:hypothetical protein FACS1894122_12780 [Alphaproteobacteria bacterium]
MKKNNKQKKENDEKMCEACRNVQWTIVNGDDDAEHPYRLCESCNNKLESYSLLPREWYNLAVIHGGNSFYLHDDFYDDNGIAADFYDEDGEIFGIDIDKEDFAPKLRNVTRDLQRLIEYCTTKWTLDKSLIKALHKYSKTDILGICKQKYIDSKSEQIRESLVRIAVETVGKETASWIRELWNEGRVDAAYLSSVSIEILPLDEAFRFIINDLRNVDGDDFPRIVYNCLYLCRSPIVLDLIEAKATKYHYYWARLAASSNPSWNRMEKWLTRGHPLSLIALEAVSLCRQNLPNDRPLAELNPTLNDAPEWSVVEKILSEYEKKDDDKQAYYSISRIRDNIDEIFR